MMMNAKRLELLKVITMFCFMLWFPFRSPTLAAMLSNETDRLALMAFKDSITHDPSGVLTSWNDSLHFCSWNGVSCGHKHPERVTRLNLGSKNLTGTLSPFIGNLSFLIGLNLSANFLQGEIPPQINLLFRLVYLLATNNSFEGIIPTNLSNLQNFRYLDLYNNELSGRIPNGISYLRKLVGVDLGYNNLVGSIPPSLGNLSFLTTLVLPDNHLQGRIPQELAQLQKLKIFDIDTNKLEGIIPPQFYNLSSLTVFSVFPNNLEGSLPWDMGLTLPNLEWLSLGGNKFWGHIPVSLLNCSQLNYVDLSGNQFSGTVPPDLGRLQHLYRLSIGNNRMGSKGGGNDLKFFSSLVNCSNLEAINVENNFLKGSLPKSITNLSSGLEVFDIGGNQIYGEIPSGFEKLKNLYYFDVGLNHITGSIPDALGELGNLQVIYMHRNKLSGRIPSTFGNLTLLSILLLAHNNLSGSLPPSLGKCQRLLQLDISYCNLTSISNQLFHLTTQITTLRLNHNAFTGRLPSQVGNLKNLVEMNISDNKFSGEIPETLGGCVSLADLYIQRNLFKGTIPQSLNALKGLEVLDVSNNNLTGRIPHFLENLPFLNNLNLSFNEFVGAVPEKGVFQNASRISLDGNHKLCGGIAVMRLPRCVGLYLKKNGKTSLIILKAIVPAIVGVMVLAALAYFIFVPRTKRLLRKHHSSTSTFNQKLQRISYGELFRATNNFSESNLIGVGSFGSVYKGIIDNEKEIIAVKVLNLQQKGGSKSFMSECKALRNIRHRNLVRILTSCSTVDFHGNDFKALVFDFMPNGSLERWLYPEDIHEGGELRNLNLVQRLNIVIDIASALEYLHNECGSTIVHSDLKPSNVLLDGEMMAHVGDFGLAKVLSSVSDNSGQSETSSFVIKGSIGYIPPEYGISGEATIEGDVYSYGILLLEMFIAKKPTNEMFKDGLSLHSYVKMSLPEKVTEIIDPRLTKEDIDPLTQECLVSMMKVGVTCSNEYPRERMHIKDVVNKLNIIKTKISK